MTMCYRHDPDRVLADHIHQVVREPPQVDTPVQLAAQPWHCWMENNPLHGRRNLVPQPRAQAWLL